jgi:multiple sugar transport system ATP-binding protein
MASIRLENIDKTFPNGQRAVSTLDLEVKDGELAVLLGPSGCGKTTILRMIAGLETPTEGRIFLDNQDVTKLSPEKRDLAMVFQSHTLYPHKTVRDNLGFSLRLRHASRDTIAERVRQVAQALELETILERKPGQLSGGERQRVALGRALVRQPQAFLFDEPLSNLDAQLRVQMRGELLRLHRKLGATMLYVTHDQEEAMVLGDRVAVLRHGKLQQMGPPLDIYRRPVNLFVAGFIGSPPMNFFQARLCRSAGEARIESPWLSGRIDCDGELSGNSQEVAVGIRPHEIRLMESGDGDAKAVINGITPLGSEVVIRASLVGPDDGPSINIVLPADCKLKNNQQVGLCFPRERLHLFDPVSECRLN